MCDSLSTTQPPSLKMSSASSSSTQMPVRSSTTSVDRWMSSISSSVNMSETDAAAASPAGEQVAFHAAPPPGARWMVHAKVITGAGARRPREPARPGAHLRRRAAPVTLASCSDAPILLIGLAC